MNRKSMNRFSVVIALILSALIVPPAPSFGQELADDMVGQHLGAWDAWSAAMRSVERDDTADASAKLEQIVPLKLSDLRLALMADRTGTVRLEQWAAKDDAPAGVKALAEQIKNGRRQKGLAEDGLHFAVIGRFGYADANFKALIDSNPDPVALLELVRYNANRQDTLLKLINNTEVGESAKAFLELLVRGEELLRMDPYEIVTNIQKLGGAPRMAYNATNRLKSSGEYAIPHLIQALQDSNRKSLHPAIIQVIPQIGRSGLNPLVQALGMKDDVTKGIIINALGRIGYKQAVPYLAKIAADSSQAPEIRTAAEQAISALGAGGVSNPAGLFYDLADLYYVGTESLAADPRSDDANIWYLRGNDLRYIPVPRAIFSDVMAMRCCEESLNLASDNDRAVALWLAANYRREAKLGLDVESEQSSPFEAKDSTRPANYPRSIYFGRAAGPRYNHMVLSRAFERRESGVALGAIAALRVTAGEPSLVGNEDYKQSMVQCLMFPNRQVRVKVALALAAALPKTAFSGSENVIPVLSEALAQSDRQAALIVDGDISVQNKLQALMRSLNYECAVGGTLYEAMQAGREANLVNYDIILLASDISEPDVSSSITELRKSFETSATPILVVAKEGEVAKAARLARESNGVEVLDAFVIDLGDFQKISEQVNARISRASQALGMSPLDRILSLDLAIQAAAVLRSVAESNLKVFDVAAATPALVGALSNASEPLRVQAGRTLALIGNVESQEALAEYALDALKGSAERIAAFGSLAESARRNGSLIAEREVVSRLIEFTMNESDLVLRSAASQALGALNLSSNKASEIIRSQHNG